MKQMTKEQLRAEAEHWKAEAQRIQAEKIATPNRVRSALKDIARKGDKVSAQLAERALVDLV